MPTLFETVKSFFEEDGWEPTRLDGQDVLRMQVLGRDNYWWMFAAAPAGTGVVVLQSVCGLATPREKMPRMAELLHRLNFGMPVAKYEIDWSDGEVRCTTGADLVGVADVRNAVRNLARVNKQTMGRDLASIFALILEDLSPEDAFARARPSR